MSFTRIREVISPEVLKDLYPLSAEGISVKAARDTEMKRIITGESDKFMVIVGPCSADNETAVLDYIHRLAKVQEKVADKLFLVPRIYTNKPRTTGEGYKGIAHQPNPEQAPNMQEGLIAVRKMHLRAIEETHLTSADEMLYPENWPYLDDILSYVAVGARSVENQQHRLAVSGMEIPAGMKNPTSGDFSVMMNSVIAAQHAHTFLFRQWEVQTTGNPYAHTILRGAVNKHGQSQPNYHYEDLIRLLAMYAEHPQLKNPAVIVDANHSNSNKKFAEQPRIVSEILHSRKVNPDVAALVKGVMIESYIEEGCQKIGEHIYGKSITDPCLGWSDTEQLLYLIADRV
ncbi:MAG: 3-deoxy-7-phosphoheptulonate synthase [Lachnospiraceae bacterium]|nr:3-deoxy-7-phosphoheptulonate synthase [Lachnospiraceae bacterium]